MDLMKFKSYQGNRLKHTSYTTSYKMTETEVQSWNYQSDWVVVKNSLGINKICQLKFLSLFVTLGFLCLLDFCVSLAFLFRASQVALVVKNLPANAGDTGDAGLIPRLGRSPGKGNDNLFHYSFLETLMYRSTWWVTVHGVTKSVTQLNTYT